MTRPEKRQGYCIFLLLPSMYVINFCPSCDVSNFVSIMLLSSKIYVKQKIVKARNVIVVNKYFFITKLFLKSSDYFLALKLLFLLLYVLSVLALQNQPNRNKPVCEILLKFQKSLLLFCLCQVVVEVLLE